LFISIFVAIGIGVKIRISFLLEPHLGFIELNRVDL